MYLHMYKRQVKQKHKLREKYWENPPYISPPYSTIGYELHGLSEDAQGP